MRLFALAILAAVALPSTARAQDGPADVPTAADESALAPSPSREEPARIDPHGIASETSTPPEGPDAGQEPDPWAEAPEQPAYATWWFWTAIGLVALGITVAVVVAVTTDAPASSVRSPLAVRF